MFLNFLNSGPTTQTIYKKYFWLPKIEECLKIKENAHLKKLVDDNEQDLITIYENLQKFLDKELANYASSIAVKKTWAWMPNIASAEMCRAALSSSEARSSINKIGISRPWSRK